MSFPSIGLVILVGVVATVVMDVWLLIISRLGVPTTDWRLVGRWMGHMPQRRFAHASIAEAAPVRGEHALGWLSREELHAQPCEPRGVWSRAVHRRCGHRIGATSFARNEISTMPL